MTLLTKQEMVEAFNRLGELAQQQGHQIELLAVGGAVMILAYNARQATHDVDVLILAPKETRIVRELAKQVAQEMGWAEDWLNDEAKGFLVGVSEGPIIFSASGIIVKRPALAQLLAMKLSAWRDDVDVDVARLVLHEMEGSQEAIWEAVVPYLVPGHELKAQYAFLDLWETTSHETTTSTLPGGVTRTIAQTSLLCAT